MRTPSRHAAALATLALVATGSVAAASSASAALVTRCIGSAGAVTVPGDLVVPAAETCVLAGTAVRGELRLQAGAALIITDGEVDGRVVVHNDAYLDATDTAFAGNVINVGAFGVSLTGSSVQGHYVGRQADRQEGFLYAEESSIGGRVEAIIGDLYLGSTTVGAEVTTEGTTYTDLIDSTVARDLTVVDNEFGAVVCASEVDGAAHLADNAYGVQIGSGGGLAECDEVNYFGGDVTISDNAGRVDVTGNIIRGDLTGTGNEPAPTGADNRVRGDLGGQFGELVPAHDRISVQSATDARDDEQSRSPEVTRAERDDRRDRAVSEGQRLGPASL